MYLSSVRDLAGTAAEEPQFECPRPVFSVSGRMKAPGEPRWLTGLACRWTLVHHPSFRVGDTRDTRYGKCSASFKVDMTNRELKN